MCLLASEDDRDSLQELVDSLNGRLGLVASISINQSISQSDDANGSRERLRAMLVRLHARSGTGARSVIYRRRLAVPLG